MAEMGSTEAHTRLVKACVAEMALMGFAAWDNKTGAAWREGRLISYGKKGSGDIIAILPRTIGGQLYGIHGEIECKTGAAIQGKKQKTHMRVVLNSGGVYIVVRAVAELAGPLSALGFPPRDPAYRTSSRVGLLL